MRQWHGYRRNDDHDEASEGLDDSAGAGSKTSSGQTTKGMSIMSIEAGNYRARAIAGKEQYGQTKNGTDQIVLEMELLDIGQTVSVFLYFSDAAAVHSMKRLRLAGWTGEDLSNLEGLGSRECDVVVKYEEYNGEQKMKVEIQSGGTVVLENQLDEKGKKAFGAKFKALAKATPIVANSAPQAAANGGAPKAGDIPF